MTWKEWVLVLAVFGLISYGVARVLVSVEMYARYSVGVR